MSLTVPPLPGKKLPFSSQTAAEIVPRKATKPPSLPGLLTVAEKAVTYGPNALFRSPDPNPHKNVVFFDAS